MNLVILTVGPVVIICCFFAMSFKVYFWLLVKMCTIRLFVNPIILHSNTVLKSDMGLTKMYTIILLVFHTGDISFLLLMAYCNIIAALNSHDCTACNKKIQANNLKYILCTICNHWRHLKCTALDMTAEYVICSLCVDELFPFCHLNTDTDLTQLYMIMMRIVVLITNC